MKSFGSPQKIPSDVPADCSRCAWHNVNKPPAVGPSIPVDADVLERVAEHCSEFAIFRWAQISRLEYGNLGEFGPGLQRENQRQRVDDLDGSGRCGGVLRTVVAHE
jgi:hypothetical protein